MGRMRRLRSDLGQSLVQGALIVPLVWGVLIGLVSGVIAFGVPASAVFGNAGDSVVGWIVLVPILVCGAIGGCVALVLAARSG
jgi:hypothetical protein